MGHLTLETDYDIWLGGNLEQIFLNHYVDIFIIEAFIIYIGFCTRDEQFNNILISTILVISQQLVD